MYAVPSILHDTVSPPVSPVGHQLTIHTMPANAASWLQPACPPQIQPDVSASLTTVLTTCRRVTPCAGYRVRLQHYPHTLSVRTLLVAAHTRNAAHTTLKHCLHVAQPAFAAASMLHAASASPTCALTALTGTNPAAAAAAVLSGLLL